MTLHTKLKEYRARYHMSQSDLAGLVEVRRETIGNLENGRYNPSITLAFKIARYFGLSIEEVFIYEESDE